jgi:hypothetical protein
MSDVEAIKETQDDSHMESGIQKGPILEQGKNNGRSTGTTTNHLRDEDLKDDNDDGSKKYVDESDTFDSYDNGLARYPCARKVIDAWPRTTVFVCRILLPLWLLIAIALGFGYLLGRYEEPNEYLQNDEIVRERFVLQQFSLNTTLTAMWNISLECIDYYTDAKDENTNTTSLDGYLETHLAAKGFDHVFPNVTPGLNKQSTEEILEEVRQYMGICSRIANSLGEDILKYVKAEGQTEAYADLTFNWIRCWNSTLYGRTI